VVYLRGDREDGGKLRENVDTIVECAARKKPFWEKKEKEKKTMSKL